MNDEKHGISVRGLLRKLSFMVDICFMALSHVCFVTSFEGWLILFFILLFSFLKLFSL